MTFSERPDSRSHRDRVSKISRLGRPEAKPRASITSARRSTKTASALSALGFGPLVSRLIGAPVEAPRPGSADLGARRGPRKAGLGPAGQHAAQGVRRQGLDQEVVHAGGQAGV